MYAIVDIAGQQFKVEKDKKLFVHRLEGDAGSEVSFDRVLLIENDGKVTIGDPVIKNAAVSAKVVEHVKGDKVLVFKKKRRKGYQKLNGHRQYLTRIEITEINEKAEKKATAAAPEKKPSPAASKADATAAVKSESGSKPAAEKPVAAEKPAAKATPAKKPAEKKAATTAKPAAKKAATEKKAATAAKPAAKKPAAKKADSGDKPTDK
jgi:large subunit ribosomal protein L21